MAPKRNIFINQQKAHENKISKDIEIKKDVDIFDSVAARPDNIYQHSRAPTESTDSTESESVSTCGELEKLESSPLLDIIANYENNDKLKDLTPMNLINEYEDSNGELDYFKRNIKNYVDNGHKSKNWCFTQWRTIKGKSFSNDEWEALKNKFLKLPVISDVHYIIFGSEIGPKSGIEHFQGFIQMKEQKRLNQLINIIGTGTANIAKMYKQGTVEGCITYCKKDGKFWEAGATPTHEGQRTDREKVIKACQDGASIKDIAKAHPEATFTFAKQITNFIHIITEPIDRHELTTIWIYGPPEIGKTTFIKKRFNKIYQKDASKWWDNYDNRYHEAIILDDFNREAWDFKTLLKILNRHDSLTCENKGGSVYINCQKYYITHAEHPDRVFKDLSAIDKWQMLRRINYIVDLRNMKIWEWSKDKISHVETDIKLENFDLVGKLQEPEHYKYYLDYIETVKEYNKVLSLTNDKNLNLHYNL